MDVALYILIFCTGSSCAPQMDHPWRYTLTRQQCIEQMHEAHYANKHQVVRCDQKGGGEDILNDGSSRYRPMARERSPRRRQD